MSKKKQDLLEHAEKLFYQNGFHAIGLKRIVHDAGVALMTLYNHFDSKEDLILEVLKNREKRYFSHLNSMAECRNTEGTVSVALLFAEAHIAWLSSSGTNGCMFLRAKEEYALENEEIVNQVIAHKKSFISFLVKQGFSHAHSIQLAMLFEGATSLSEILDVNDIAIQFRSLIKDSFRE
ncbi:MULTISPECIES: TetR/AcrR family transcriptional regulator [Virgibacillus]|uniref:Pyrimidine utilization regulatory protein R n=2 Tax=Virgibacillus TaxID=84406 RepID=A0A024QA93_9BACI|nr:MULTISPECIES: TetR/AcrR family transcriptional regulator [Virgibacillus]EQB37372.1 hypothetical protein M948_02185 [Virgibacillus sp. CM-4]MYL40125.1 TetR family transcriptional regulator [Virgibacillus massiliensis]GGJ61406.1 TetR family transcriptional regulator [Virgibacillus kapii]CDQ39130.1 pyrimidine utilization regulatory protein R [Virgibacillus massiliensis]